jgi:hypothetical protein
MDKDYLPILRDSIETSVNMKLFNSVYDSMYAHIYKSKLIKFPLSISSLENLNNFNINRLQKNPINSYPSHNRPRGKKNLSSIKSHLKLLQKKSNTLPIWIIYINNKFILLDGVHRIIANYIHNKKYIYSYLIII